MGAAGSRPHLTLSSYADVREAFRHKDLGQALYDEGGVVMRDVLLTLHGEVHRTRRRAENVLFSLDAIRDHQMRLIPDTVRETLAPFFGAGAADLVRAGHLVTMNLVANLVGVDRPLRTHAETDELHACALTLFKGAALVHATGDKEQLRTDAAAAMRRLDQRFLTPSIERRLASGQPAPDLLGTLVASREQLSMSLEDVKREVAFYLEGGSHSTATALTDAVHDLFEWCAAHPQDLNRARQDIRFLQRCAHETLRLHPASPVAWRRALSEVRLAGRTVPAGALVVLDLMAANRDPAAYGEDAGSFDPTRRLPAGVSPWGTTFGGGIHACIGQIFAAGLPAAEGASGLYGALPLMMRALLEAGMRPDPARPPAADRHLARPHFGSYWVLFDSVPAIA